MPRYNITVIDVPHEVYKDFIARLEGFDYDVECAHDFMQGHLLKSGEPCSCGMRTCKDCGEVQ